MLMELAEDRRTPCRSLSWQAAKMFFTPVWRVVEVAAHGAYAHVRALLRGHLRLLHGGHAPVRVKDDDARAGHVVEALERGLAGVAGGGGQDDDLIVDAADRLGRGNQARQQAQRDVLERARRAAEELEDIAVAHLRGAA